MTKMDTNTTGEAEDNPQTQPPIRIESIIKDFDFFTENIKPIIKHDSEFTYKSTTNNITINTRQITIKPQSNF